MMLHWEELIAGIADAQDGLGAKAAGWDGESNRLLGDVVWRERHAAGRSVGALI